MPQWRGGGVNVVAIEAEAGFEPQRIAGAEADRLAILMGQQCLDQFLGLVGRNGDFVAILAGIAGAGDNAGSADERHVAHIHEFHGCDLRCQRRQHRFRCRTLKRDQSTVFEKRHRTAERCACMCATSAALQAAFNDDQQVIAAIGDHQVVEDAAILIVKKP